MRIFHFIKYDEHTSPGDLLPRAIGETILCLDLEDSIQDCFNPAITPELKKHYRKCFVSILRKMNALHTGIKLGVRINAADSAEYSNDIDALAAVNFISVIFLPKTKGVEQILDLQQQLMKRGVTYDEIIPVIETKAGMNNLEGMVSSEACHLKSVAFGHCDYNLDNGIYPFFHQHSRGYWTWITTMINILGPYKISLVNSPYLQLHNDSFFKEMLSVLHALGGGKIGQIVLNTAQSRICNAFVAHPGQFISFQITHTLDLRVPDNYANNFIKAFELNVEQRGVAIDDKGVLLSPQEYQASLSYQNKNYLTDINFTFVGGCFPVQGDILFEDLFHQVVRRRIEEAKKVKFNVNIIRYERFANSLHKISRSLDQHPIDVLTFSIRPEPFLRLVKFYYRYYDQVSKSKKWSLNLPWMNLANPEKFDLLTTPNGFPSAGMPGGSFTRKFFRQLNYMAGTLAGNEKFAWDLYEKLIKEVIHFCHQHNIKLILLGPPVPFRSGMGAKLSRKLVRQVKNLVSSSNAQFVDGAIGRKNDADWFDGNGIYASEKYHEVMADRLYRSLRTHGSVQGIPYDAPILVMPIPQSEMDTNSQMEQNEAYL